MATNITEELKEDTHCAICRERFKDPRMLPCVHTFCMGCLDNCEKNLRGRKFTCPTCRRVVDIPNGVQGLPKNFYIVNLMEKLELAESVVDSAKCKFCRVEGGVLICLDCKCHLCRLCKNVHDRLPGLHDHTVAEIDKLTDSQYMSKLLKNKPPCCDKHPQEKLRFYCKDCSVLICRDCTLLNHKSHEYVDAADVIGVVTSKLHILLDGSERQAMNIERDRKRMESLADDTRTRASDCRAEIKAHYSAFVAKLKSDQDTLLKKVDKIVEERCAPLARKVTEMTNQLKAFEDNENMTRQILDGKNQWEIMRMETHLKNAFDKLELENGAAVALCVGEGDSNCSFRFGIKELPTGNSLGELEFESISPLQELVNEKIQGQQLENEQERLISELEKLNLDRDKLLRQEIDQDETRYKALGSKMDDALEKSIQIEDEKIKSLESRLKESVSRNKTLTGHLDLLKKDFESIQQQQVGKTGSNDKDDKKSKKTVSDIAEEVMRMKDHLVSVERMNATHMTENNNLKDQLHVVRDQCNSKTAEVQAYLSKLEALQEGSTNAKLNYAKLQVENRALESQNTSLQGRIATKVADLEGLRERYDGLDSLHEALLGDYAISLQMHDSLTDDYDALVEQHKHLELLYRDVKADLQEEEAKLRQYRRQPATTTNTTITTNDSM